MNYTALISVVILAIAVQVVPSKARWIPILLLIPALAVVALTGERSWVRISIALILAAYVVMVAAIWRKQR